MNHNLPDEPETMRMIREIRLKHYEETKNMTTEEKRAYYKAKAERVIKELDSEPHRVSFAKRK